MVLHYGEKRRGPILKERRGSHTEKENFSKKKKKKKSDKGSQKGGKSSGLI